MVEVKEVKTNREIKAFIDFPLSLYKDNPYFVPPLYGSEKALFKKNNPYSSCSDTLYLLASKDGQVVGRISGIIQKDANEKYHQKNVRFTRFDSIDDQEVANALFDTVSKWAMEKGMDHIQGPLGFNDLEREGLLIEGFDKLASFEEQYNFPYYQKLIENYGFVKDTDWLEQELRLPENHKEIKENLLRMQNMIFKRYKLHFAEQKSVSKFLDQNRDEFFKLLDDSYSGLYGTCPIRKEVQDDLVEGIKILIKRENIFIIYNEKNEIVAFSLSFPSIAEAIRKSNGKLTPAALIRILHAISKPKVMDLGLIGIREDYKNSGIPVAMMVKVFDLFEKGNYDHVETNLTLETNEPILNLLSRFDGKFHKKRRAYIKAM